MSASDSMLPAPLRFAVPRSVVPFEANDAAVFFLRRGTDGLWRPVGLSMGVFRIRANRATGRAEIRPPVLGGSTTAATGPVVRGDRRRMPLSLQEFDALVRIAMAPAQPERAGRR